MSRSTFRASKRLRSGDSHLRTAKNGWIFVSGQLRLRAIRAIESKLKPCREPRDTRVLRYCKTAQDCQPTRELENFWTNTTVEQVGTASTTCLRLSMCLRRLVNIFRSTASLSSRVSGVPGKRRTKRGNRANSRRCDLQLLLRRDSGRMAVRR
jgi:hypothetical protein